MRLMIMCTLLSMAISCNSRSKGKSTQEIYNNDSIERERSAVCFVYHRFGDSEYPSTNVSLEDFAAHLQYLQDNQFIVMTLSDAVKYLKSGGDNEKVAVITIDDGYNSFKSGGMPLLRKYGYPATLFVNTETVGGGDYLDWEELRQLSKEGVEIGNHSHSHAYFLNIPDRERIQQFIYDIEKAQGLLQKHLGIKPAVLAYPYGEYSPEMKDAAEQMGFVAATAQNSGVMSNHSDYFALPRFPMANAYAAINGFAEKVRMEPLSVKKEYPKSVLISENPPELEVNFINDQLNVGSLQCFVQGGSCEMQVIHKDPLSIKLKANAQLNKRRTLYTITAQSKNGQWHWYSHLWVKPEVKE
ncbi:polysaccharide deacetylase family protein [Fulvivirga sp. 29W222]|uniref:Polysaccharide deacetylase family protein n=1 Tax=Fulvivirga marina TaxID=2494733 RepID=A0A937FZF5_9BACT|nr:polysaccharide deacetylase family protein [Fulvivirga marina]MBL6449004.1 polysaccharide deacetylase family protein [Fulvivirga marina]